MSNILKGRVVDMLSPISLVINKGSNDGVTPNNKFLIYRLGKEIIDPETKENLGTLEIVCGEAQPEHIQEKITTVISSKKELKNNKTIVKTNGFGIFGERIEERENPITSPEPFQNMKDKDITYYFKQI